jgi:hypothetical protein
MLARGEKNDVFLPHFVSTTSTYTDKVILGCYLLLLDEIVFLFFCLLDSAKRFISYVIAMNVHQIHPLIIVSDFCNSFVHQIYISSYIWMLFDWTLSVCLLPHLCLFGCTKVCIFSYIPIIC